MIFVSVLIKIPLQWKVNANVQHSPQAEKQLCTQSQSDSQTPAKTSTVDVWK